MIFFKTFPTYIYIFPFCKPTSWGQSSFLLCFYSMVRFSHMWRSGCTDRLVCVKMVVELIMPVACEQSMRFAIREGGKTVGAGVIQSIIE